MSTFKPGILLSLLILPLVASGQDSDSGGRHPLFQTDEVLKAVLTAPIAQTYAHRHQEVRIYHPGQWTYIDEDDRTQRLDVSIRTRGHFRREVCDLPPAIAAQLQEITGQRNAFCGPEQGQTRGTVQGG